MEMKYYLQHHGVLGQKWGVRRYQNADGSLTEAGRKRYNRVEKRINRGVQRINKIREKDMAGWDRSRNRIESRYDKKMAKLDKKMQKLASRKERRLNTFDENRAAVNKGYDTYTKIITDYKNATLKGLTDKSFKSSPEYRKAVAKYVGQVALTVGYTGDPMLTAYLYSDLKKK